MGLKIGFIGNGLISWAHVLAIKALEKAGFVEIDEIANYDPDENKANNFASVNKSQKLKDVTQVLKECDLIWICTPTKYHAEIVKLAAQYKKGVFCEKPLGVNLNEVREIKDVVLSSGIYFQVGLVLRTAPVFLKIKQIVNEGLYGDVLGVSLIDDQFFPIQGHYLSTWRSDFNLTGGGTLIEHSIHDIDILRFCFGDILKVAGFTSNHYNYKGVEDTAAVSFQHYGNVNSTLLSIWHQILSRGSTRRLQTFFSLAVVISDDDFLGPIKIITKDKDFTIKPEVPEFFNAIDLPQNEIGLAVKMYCSENFNFINNFLEKKQPSPNIEDGLYVHDIVEKIYQFDKKYNEVF